MSVDNTLYIKYITIMKNKKHKSISGDLLNISIGSDKTKTILSTSDYNIYQEDDGYWCITFNDKILIRTKPSDKIINELIDWGILPIKEDTEFIEQFKSYLIIAAKAFINQGLYNKKQDGRGKIDIPGIDDEF